MSWLNFNLVPYIAHLCILPDTQVATQQGVQTRDLISYLSSISCWVKRHKVTVYALKRDQMKGFDYLSPQGMYDAVSAYGLPSAIIDLDHAAQTDTKCYIRTAYGTTEPILISGLTKQGGSLSPVKSTLTTSLGHHYLNDLSANNPATLIISTANGMKGDPHLVDDHLSCKVVMVEVTDDSYLFARSLAALQRNTLAMEHFHITTHRVALRSNELEFLRTLVDNPHTHYKELKEFIQHFTFPKFLRCPPITLLRKILKQNVVSKAHALISLQPIKRADADKLDKMLKTLMHRESGMPFEPNPDVLTLPTEFHGLDIPSISYVNNAVAVNGLHRDLNHPIASYRTVARITLTDWTCTINNCIDPLDSRSLSRTFPLHAGRIPYSWIVAQDVMASSTPTLALKRTDLPDILPGTMSLSHALKTIAQHLLDRLVPAGNALWSLRSKNITRILDVGQWHLQMDGKWSFKTHQRPATGFIFNDKSVTAAVTGPRTLVLRIDGHNILILHGELVGIILALTLSDLAVPSTLYTDHLNSVHIINDSKTVIDQAPRLRTLNGRSYYRWILALTTNNPLRISYTPGHSDEVSLPARLNYEADHYASSAQWQPREILSAPIPPFFMDEYTFYSHDDGWTESNIMTYLHKSRSLSTSQALASGHQLRMTLHLYDPRPPPEFPYTHAYSAYSVLVQLYVRSGQLPTADLLHSCKLLPDACCRMGCDAIEDAHHIFVHCMRYDEWRASAAVELQKRALPKLIEKEFEEVECIDFLAEAKLLHHHPSMNSF
ncbi:hypothetical protein DFH08DRAFT_702295 [Mycena albidolilacea]|uniref:Uncharacterized protein n=1 Tax=Mycena albidolilacea TaxID=1033008 RepID=A0AAD6ZWW7_9AGAR|nr:hypothetical protein DFH08DRAFT_702295 [Mycena albidolilacea]